MARVFVSTPDIENSIMAPRIGLLPLMFAVALHGNVSSG
jgi:hypothetical protein